MEILSKVTTESPLVSVAMLPELVGIDSDDCSSITRNNGKPACVLSVGIDTGKPARIATAAYEQIRHN